jgi:electron transport complex protein RnfG
MKSNIYIIAVLTLITAASGGILSYWDRVTAPVIEHNRTVEFEKTMREVMPPYDRLEQKGEGDVFLYTAYLHDEPVAHAIRSATNGFQSRIEILYSISVDKKRVLKLKILEQMETPGLGTKIANDSSREETGWFASQFAGRELSPEIVYVKNRAPEKPNEVEAITGATISTRAVVGQVNRSLGSGVWQK